MKLSGTPSKRVLPRTTLSVLRSRAAMEGLRDHEVADAPCLECRVPLVIRVGRRGPFLACPGPDCKSNPIDLFRNFDVLPGGARWDGFEATFFRDERGEPLS